MRFGPTEKELEAFHKVMEEIHAEEMKRFYNSKFYKRRQERDEKRARRIEAQRAERSKG